MRHRHEHADIEAVGRTEGGKERGHLAIEVHGDDLFDGIGVGRIAVSTGVLQRDLHIAVAQIEAIEAAVLDALGEQAHAEVSASAGCDPPAEGA